mgnify:CR=1 FL=1
MDVFSNTEVQPRDEIFEMGKEFAFEGLTEEYFKANNEEELEETDLEDNIVFKRFNKLNK